MARPVVAGVDGSPPSLAAAGYAAGIADARGVPLKLVHGYLHPFGYGSAPMDPYQSIPPPPPADGDVMLERLADQLRTRHPGLEVSYDQPAGGGAAALVRESETAGLVVVGNRGHGGFAGLLLGSVSSHVSAHARCPVLVVRPPAADASPAGADAPVVAGVDGSEGSLRAAGYAAAEAVRESRPLLLLAAGAARDGDGVPAAEPIAPEDAADRTVGDLARAAAEIRDRWPDLTVTPRRVAERPAAALVAASREAALVVVGSRGRGGFTGLLLGSVSQALLHHASCPVLVVPPHAPPV